MMETGKKGIDRRTFLETGACFAASGALLADCGGKEDGLYDSLQNEIDLVSHVDYVGYLGDGNVRSLAALKRLDGVFDSVLSQVRSTKVSDPDRPAVWYVYNMGIVVKTVERTFSIDLVHRRAAEFAPFLDFALITHNHDDHWRHGFYDAMNSAGKTVVSNFLDNYGVRGKKGIGGFTRAAKTFTLGDVAVKTGLTDHNAYLADFTSFFEVHVGKFTIFHSGDCSNSSKLVFTRRPDLWIVHPYCGMDVPKAAAESVKPERVVIAHLQELGHAKDRWRWTYADGMKVKTGLAEAGIDSVMPVWGERIA